MQPVPLPEVQEEMAVKEKMRLALPATAQQVQDWLSLAMRLRDPRVSLALQVEVRRQEATADYTGDSNNDAVEWLVVGT